MKNRYKNVFFLLLSILKAEAVCDLMVSGPLDFCDGLGKIAYGIIDQVSDVLDVRYHTGSFCLFSDDPYNVMSRTKKEKDAKGSGIFLYSNGIVAGIQDDSYLFESKDTVKIAYSMFEATEIPQEWVKQLNNHFDQMGHLFLPNMDQRKFLSHQAFHNLYRAESFQNQN